jgi:two-component system phosphate regulon response regulator PhoB
MNPNLSNTKPLAVIIEDEAFLAEIFSDTLQGAGFNTKVLHDGDTAILYLARARPELVLLDLNLPRYSGANIYTFICGEERLLNTWVIIATADANQAANFRTTESKNNKLFVLDKPVGVEQLHQLSRKLVFG